MSQFDESKHNRATDGKFAHKPHSEADGVSLTPKTRGGKRSKEQRRQYAMERAEKMRGQIEDEVEKLRDPEQWKQMLDFMSKFHNYSFGNQRLIEAQYPGAQLTAGFRQWQQRGRQVRKGEKGLTIFGFATKKVPKKDADGEPRETGEDEEDDYYVYYPTLTVFDVDQTDPIEGYDQPALLPSRLHAPDPTDTFNKTRAHLEGLGWKVVRPHIAGATHGYMNPDGKVVAVDARLEGADATKTLLHEAAHAHLHADLGSAYHTDEDVRGLAEVEAESTAYVVAGAMGLDTKPYSIGYITGWAGRDNKALRRSGEAVQKAARTLINALTEDEG